MSRPLFAVVLVAALIDVVNPISSAAQGDLSVLSGQMFFTDAKNALYTHLSNLAFEKLDDREALVAELRSDVDWEARRRYVRRTLRDLAGQFPERSPLNARVTGVLEGDGFRVEKLLYESMPGFFVTAAVFVPEGIDARRPAIVYASGHSADGFRAAPYQTAILNLVKKGFIVLAFDPVGQGERRQYNDPETGTSRIGGPTREHSYPGAQIFITGDSPALYFIWDGVRAIDYLHSRPDVDTERIGATGRSGGGTQSSYFAAFDDRVRAVAPENYLTSFRRLLESIGLQDAEQNFFHGIAQGIDHADLIIAHAPKPYLVIATTRDMFSIQGVRETVREARSAYAAMGQADNLRLVEDDAPHASTRRNREAMYAFFQEALDLPGETREVEVQVFEPTELYTSETGQVATMPNTEDLFTLNRRRAAEMVERLAGRRQSEFGTDAVVAAARNLSGYEAPSHGGEAVFRGRLRRDGYVIEKYFVPGEGDYVLPMLLLIPDGDGPHPAVIYLQPEGKASDAAGGGVMESLVRRGYVVLAPDLLGFGELGNSDFRGDAYDYGVGVGAYNIWWTANQAGRSLVGINAGDIIRTVQFLRSRSDVNQDRLSAIGIGELGPVLLHATAFDRSISDVVLVQSPTTYESFVLNRYYRPELVHAVVPGALREYDLPDLAATLAPRGLLLLNAIDQWGEPVSVEETRNTYQQNLPTGGRFDVLHTRLAESWIEAVADWLDRGRR
jgi:cephalosporin-C deacetylase-like acetyl esterase